MTVGIIGAGSFGITLATLISENHRVLVYTRSKDKLDTINLERISHGVSLSEKIKATDDVEEVAACKLLFPVVPSSSFREVIQLFQPYLNPEHIILHGTKGLDVEGIRDEELLNVYFQRKQVHTMSEVVRKESTVVRVGTVAGPNLAREILDGQPAAAVIASEFNEVIRLGSSILSSRRFFTFGNHDLKGTELAGAYKNIIALGSGMLAGLDMGKNMQAILINRGLHEMIKFGLAFGATTKPFFGAAGIGDLVATATSENSRNFTFGKRLAQGETLEHILQSSEEIVEGVRTLRIVRQLARNEELFLPITEIIYKVVFDQMDTDKAISLLMRYNYAEDVDFI